VRPFGVAGLQLHISGRGATSPTWPPGGPGHGLFPWVEMVIFSELAAFGPSKGQGRALPGPAEERLRRDGPEARLWIVTGSLYEKRRDGIYNTASVIDPGGGGGASPEALSLSPPTSRG
jgi:deaminated glutathione amidase